MNQSNSGVLVRWSLEQLRQFVAIADHGSISAAARYLGKVQSTVSNSVALLEADLHVVLFDRTKHKAKLTDAGLVLMREAVELLRQAAELQQRANAFSLGEEARLALALDTALPSRAVRTLVRETSQRFPSLELTLLNGTATELAGHVEQRRADIAINFDSRPLANNFGQKNIVTVAQGVFVAEGHPVLEAKPARVKDLAKYRQLLWHSADVQQTAYSTKIWRSDRLCTIVEMVADGLGWAVLPVSIAKHVGYPESLVSVDCSWITMRELTVRMFWLQGNEPTETAKWLAARLGQLLN